MTLYDYLSPQICPFWFTFCDCHILSHFQHWGFRWSIAGSFMWNKNIQKHDGKIWKVRVKCGKVHVPIVLGPAMKLLQCHSLWGPAWSLCEILLSPSMNSNTRSAQGGSLRQAEICLQSSALKCILKPFGWTLQVDRFKDVGTVLAVLQLRIWHLVSGYVKGFEAIAVLWWLQILSVMCRTSTI